MGEEAGYALPGEREELMESCRAAEVGDCVEEDIDCL
jgi:hypothetical protein